MTASSGAARAVGAVVGRVLPGGLPVPVRCWDGSTLGPADGPATIVLRSPEALRRLLWAPGELGFARAYVAGELDVEGDIFAALQLRDQLPAGEHAPAVGGTGWVDTLRAARQVGVIGLPPAAPPEEARLHGRRHTRQRDAAAISHHYDISNDFYRLVLGPSMTYSCAYFEEPDAPLEDAQSAKYELVCRKLGITEGSRLLDVGCGWGGMVLHAAGHHGATAVGVTVSARQADLAAKRVADAGLTGKVEIRFQDYRDVDDGPYDAISSIGMFEHVGSAMLTEYFGHMRELVRPGGRFLNHGITRPQPGGRARLARRSFIDRYVFPDGELHEVGRVVSAIQDAGFEVRDVESLREHYARTLRHWVANLESGWDDAVAVVGRPKARVWRLYMAASALNFEAGRTSIHQIVGVRPGSGGESGFPATREAWLRS